MLFDELESGHRVGGCRIFLGSWDCGVSGAQLRVERTYRTYRVLEEEDLLVDASDDIERS